MKKFLQVKTYEYRTGYFHSKVQTSKTCLNFDKMQHLPVYLTLNLYRR
jgi:hypothetical protein